MQAFTESTLKVHVITSMKQLESSMNKAAEVAESRDGMFIDFIIPTNKEFGYYYVEGTEAYHLVHFWINAAGQSCCTCSCVSSYICYHIGSIVNYHIARKAKLVTNKKVTNYTAPTTDANSTIGLAAKANAEKIMKIIKEPEVFKFDSKEEGVCAWCDLNKVQELDAFSKCLTCCKKAFETRQNLEIKPTNHQYDKYKKVSGKIKLGSAKNAYAKGAMLD